MAVFGPGRFRGFASSLLAWPVRSLQTTLLCGHIGRMAGACLQNPCLNIPCPKPPGTECPWISAIPWTTRCGCALRKGSALSAEFKKRNSLIWISGFRIKPFFKRVCRVWSPTALRRQHKMCSWTFPCVKNPLTTRGRDGIIYLAICASAGTGRQARLRCVCLRRTGSSPVSRTSLPPSYKWVGAFIYLSSQGGWFKRSLLAMMKKEKYQKEGYKGCLK